MFSKKKYFKAIKVSLTATNLNSVEFYKIVNKMFLFTNFEFIDVVCPRLRQNSMTTIESLARILLSIKASP